MEHFGDQVKSEPTKLPLFTPKQADDGLLVELVLEYYQIHFPYKKIWNWLTYANPSSNKPEIIPENREFAFRIHSWNGVSFWRNISFTDYLELREKMVTSNYKILKLEVGASFDKSPNPLRVVGRKLSATSASQTEFKPTKVEEKEFQLDIDLNSYDHIRTCCSGSQSCKLCWKFIIAAQKVLNETLREDFGFEHNLWVFSGLKGAHCWTCDKRARILDHSVRNSMLNYLTLSTHNLTRSFLCKPRVTHDYDHDHRVFQNSLFE